MQVRVLGPLQVCRAGRVWSPGGPKERRLLAVLVIRLGQVVSVDALAEALWDGAPPPSAVKSVQAYVARLRAALAPAGSGGGVIRTAAPGYRLDLDRVAVDAYAFMDLVRQARRAVEDGVPEQAERHLAEAFALWRGEPYGEFANHEVFAAEARRLEETRVAALEIQLAAGLAMGRHADLVADAQTLCAAHPLREQCWVHLVTALYRCGRQGEALAALSRIRALLVDELGADPGAELRMLEQQVLRQDPHLTVPTGRRPAEPPLPPELDPAGRPFFGRGEELAWLQDAWADVITSRRSRLVVIAGPAGSGRTRLVGEFAARLHGQGVTVHYGNLGAGLAVLDDLDDRSVPLLGAQAGAGPMLCVATYDPTRAGAALRRALLATAHEERVLSPLGRVAVAKIVTRIAGAADAGLEEEVARAAGGWPGPAEGIASRLVEERSARRVVAAVDQARPASRVLAAARSEVTAGVRDLARVRALHGDARAGPDRIACPYKGLAQYEQGDAVLFHGREDLVARLCARLVDTVFVAVVGPSGAGKSSLVRAGLLPALAAGVLPGLTGARQYLLAVDDPLPVLDTPAVVVVDQFEEVFAATTDDAVRDGYLDALTGLARRPDTRIVVVLRGDFVGACAAHARLAELIGDGTVLVGPMRPEEIRRVVELPAGQVGLQAEPALVDTIVSDMEGAPGALPLLSTALVQVWQGRADGALSMAAYHRAGGVSGALARLGEAAFTGLDRAAQVAARRLLLRLAETGDGGVLVRRRVPRSQLGGDPATTRALAVLVARRLLSADDAGVEVAHEALLTHWPRLTGWLAEDEQGRALRRHLTPAAVEWDGVGRPDAELYRGARLAGALDWAGDRLADLTGVENDFLTASRDFSDREIADEIARADRQARGRHLLLAALAASVGLLLVASGAAWIAVDRRRAAAAASHQALAHRLGALALVTPDLDRSLLLAVQAVRTVDDWETRGDLLAVLGRSPQALRQVRAPGDQGWFEHVALTPDGSTLVASQGAGGGRVFTWDAATLAPTGVLTRAGQRAEAIVPGPEPTSMFISAATDIVKGTQAVIHWDARTHSSIATYELPAQIAGSTRRVALSADGRVLAVPTQDPLLLLYQRNPGTPPVRIPLTGVAGDIWPAGPLLVTAPEGSATAVFIDPAAGRVAQTLPLPFAGTVMASPDGRALLVFAGARATLIDATDARVIQNFSGTIRAGASAAFSADGTLLAIAGDDQRVDVWDVGTGELRDTLRGHAAPVHGLVFAADGRTLYTAGRDGTLIAWDVLGDLSFTTRGVRAPALPRPAASAANGLATIVTPLAAWSNDRRRVYVAAADGSAASLIDVASGRAVSSQPPIAVDPHAATPVADLDRNAMFGTTRPGLLIRYDLRTGKQTGSFSAERPLLNYAVAVSADGRVLAVETEEEVAPGEFAVRGVNLLDPDTLAVRHRLPPLSFPPYVMWLDQVGSLLVATEFGGTHVELWDVPTARPRWNTDVGLSGTAIALSPNGRTLVVGANDGAAVLLDVTTGRVLTGHTLRLPSYIASAEFSPDGTVIALGGDDGQVHLLEADTLHEIGQLPTGTGATWAFVAYTTGSMLSAVDERGRVVHWDTRPQSWINRACMIVGGRDLTPAEWATYLPDTPHQRTCSAR